MALIFSLYLGTDADLPAWQGLASRHAAWLGLHPRSLSLRPAPEKCLQATWFGTAPAGAPEPPRGGADWLLFSSGEAGAREAPAAAPGELRRLLPARLERNVVEIAACARSGEVLALVPPATAEQLFFAAGDRGIAVANDLRLLAAWAGLELDERAVFALFRYAAVPAPLTITRRAGRVPGGHVLTLRQGEAPRLEVFFQPGKEARREAGSETGAESPANAVRSALDGVLARVPPPAALFFSGGVDSSLLAARLAAAGRRDVRLINYAFGDGDREGEHALRVARHLDLPCEQIRYRPRDVSGILERAARDYCVPFGDRSVIPTNLLVRAARPLLAEGAAVLEGTGGDGAFGMWPARTRWSSLPRPVLRLLAAAYAGLRLWRSNSELDRLGRQARRRAQMPPLQAVVVARNCLHGIAYTIPRAVDAELTETIASRMEVLGAGLPVEEQLSVVDLVHVCAGIFAEKSYDPLRLLGVGAVYPFLEPPMVRAALSLGAREKCAGGRGKALLKLLLAESLPRELIERPKSGFNPPFEDVLTYPDVKEYVRGVVLAPRNRLLDFCEVRTVEAMFARAELGQPLSKEAHKFLWTLMFATAWLQALESRALEEKSPEPRRAKAPVS